MNLQLKQGDEHPVFVASSGRRAHLLWVLGIVIALACLAYAALIGISFMGDSGRAPDPVPASSAAYRSVSVP
ncbi:hypothetical protein ABT381_26085 [Streptomyces sp. NPDC000151]|uniref:hypothetical protein n=1 Tax=Streptomyces sp. NPDC000151 TaxID=3154244 RepID=UPI00331DA30B